MSGRARQRARKRAQKQAESVVDVYDPKTLDSNFYVNIIMGMRMISGKLSEQSPERQREIIAAAEENARAYCARRGQTFVKLTQKL